MRKNVHSQWLGDTYPLTAEEELSVVDTIRKGASHDASPEERKKSHDAVFTLISSYSPLIEKIAQERMRTRGGYNHSPEDFVAEAYLIAIQCAMNFDPRKSSHPIRFSSYVSRAISSALHRLNAKTHTVSSISANTISQARKWSHVYYDMRSKGITPTDDDISDISGAEFSFDEVSLILGATVDETLDNAFHIGVNDTISSADEERNTKNLDSSVDAVYGDYADMVKALLGIGYTYVSSTIAELSDATGKKKSEVRKFLAMSGELLHHPAYRVRLSRHLNV